MIDHFFIFFPGNPPVNFRIIFGLINRSVLQHDVDKGILGHPIRCKASIIPANCPRLLSLPSPPWLTSRLMQNTQRKLQLVIKTVPEPFYPTSGFSSPKCGWNEEISTREFEPQKPLSPFSRLA